MCYTIDSSYFHCPPRGLFPRLVLGILGRGSGWKRLENNEEMAIKENRKNLQLSHDILLANYDA